MSQQTRDDLSAEILTSFPDNNQKRITEAILRAFLQNLIDSALLPLSDGSFNGILVTIGAPSNSLGINGAFAIDPAARVIYGPKTSGIWPAGVSFNGSNGQNGQGVPTGGAVNQVLAKASSTDYATVWVNSSAGTPDVPETLTISDATPKITTRPAGVTNHLVKVNLAAGSGPYIAPVTLDVGNTPTIATNMRLVFNLPASTNPTIAVKTGTTTLATITNPSGQAGISTLDVSYDGISAWYVALESDGTTSDELRFTIATATPGATYLFQVERPFNISSWNFVGNTSGSITIGIRKATTIGGLTSIVASTPPAVSGAQNGRSAVLTGWTTQLNALDFIEVSVSSASGFSNGVLTFGGSR